MQYGPNDPAVRSRIFNLQTGHAGAFYNCDGEEDKRNSPYICWKSSHGSHWYRSIYDVLQWKRDRREIAQRICDGAGACCGGKCEQKTNVECGCQTCSGQSSVVLVANNQVTDKAGRTTVAHSKSKTSKLSVRGSVAGLLSTNPAVKSVSRSVSKQGGLIAGAVAAKKPVLKNTKTAECDCLACRAKRGIKTQASLSTKEKEIAPVRSASLLERARAIRNR